MIIARLIGHTQFTLRQLVEILSATYLFFFFQLVSARKQDSNQVTC